MKKNNSLTAACWLCSRIYKIAQIETMNQILDLSSLSPETLEGMAKAVRTLIDGHNNELNAISCKFNEGTKPEERAELFARRREHLTALNELENVWETIVK